MTKISWWWLGAALLSLASGCSRESGPASVVLLSIDTLRADHLGSHGYPRDTSPFLDTLARDGTHFANAWAPSPWTLPSHATLLTGLYPNHHGATRSELSIAASAPRLAQAMSEAGYATCGVVTSIFVSDKYGFGQGFDHFDDFGIHSGERESQDAPDAAEVFAKALDWARAQDADRPLFVFLHVYDVHYPYDAPDGFDRKYDPPSTEEELKYENYFHYLRQPLNPAQMRHQINQYDEEIAYVDAQLRAFHESWTRLRPDTVFMITADHGEEFGERGSWGHAHTLYPEQLHVPLIVAGAGVKSQRIEQRVGLEDVAPTLTALAGAFLAGTDGVDRSAQIQTGVNAGDDVVAARFAASSRFKTLLHRWHDPPYDLIVDLARARYELYDLKEDPRARQDVLARNAPAAERLDVDLYAWLGEPWQALREGKVTTDGVIVAGGRRIGPELAVVAGGSFAVFPLDAKVTFEAEDVHSGPFAAAGGSLPDDDDPGLRFVGPRLQSRAATLTEEERERLKALGYVH